MELDTKEIMRILPHRYPFLLVDRITKVDVEAGVIVGLKNLTMNEQFFQGHFPDAPIMPGVLILEALAQTGGILIHLKEEDKKIAILLNMNDVKFRHPAKPGDTLILRCEAKHLTSKGGRFYSQAFINDKLATEAEIGFVLVDKQSI